ncbi:hypothetical protein AA14337_3103 [Acetobacter malorum DSM 14337]|uniref:Uncharacterized protein n=1 Tax=Acetobacter malorum DSM 14337 TaxID=1307910 RepID=A0ABQ0PZM0_9PROT|nr:hypothetical protein AA14337_3103 [Acetobacter malorum DSM 14337]
MPAFMTASATFLSRLCGGDGENGGMTVVGRFLSRLCGGDAGEKAYQAEIKISKPPMRR